MIRLQVPLAVLISAASLGTPSLVWLPEHPSPVSLGISQNQEFDGSPAGILIRAMRHMEGGDTAAASTWVSALSSSAGDRMANLGRSVFAWLKYDFEEAETLLGALLDEAPAPDRITPYAWILKGEVAATTGRLQEADQAFSRALETARQLDDSRGSAWSLIRLANVRARLSGDPTVLQELLGQAEPLIDDGDAFLRGQYHCARAGNDPSGRATAEEDASIGANFARQAGVRRLHAACLHVLAATQLRTGRTADALNTFWEEQTEQEAIGDRAGRAATLQWSGFVLFTLGDYGESRAYLLEAVADGQASGNLSPVAWAHMSLSGIALGLGDLVSAREHLDNAEELLVQQGDRWGLTTLAGRKAALAFAAGNWVGARELWKETQLRHETARDAVGMLGSLTGLLEVAIAQGELDEAERTLAEARDLARDAGMGSWEVALQFHEAEIALQKGELERASESLEAFLEPGQFSVRVYRAQARYAEVLARQGKSQEAREVLEAALDALEEWRNDLDGAQLQSYAFQIGEYLPDPDLGIATVISAIAESGQVAQAFRLAERQRARHLYEQLLRADVARVRAVSAPDESHRVPNPERPLDAQGVISAIPDDRTAVIQYLTGSNGEPTTVFSFTRQGMTAEIIAPIDSLRRDIDLLLATVRGGAGSTSARRLGEQILEPAFRTIPPSVTRLVVIPDGILYRLPFDLLETDDQGPIVRRFAVSTAPSATILARLWGTEERSNGSVLAFGDPEIPRGIQETLSPDGGGAAEHLSEDGVVLSTDRLPPLPGARREVRAVARYGDPTEVRTGADASERFLRSSSVGDYGVIHFATHALVDESTPSRTALILSPGEGEDGLVSPGEIAHLELGADLVVLSACRTAGGAVVRGEGIQGLTAPLLQAGARSVVATQWPIDDRSSRGIVEGFYRQLARGHSVSEAMRLAKLDALDRRAPPASWAAFTVVGNPDVGISLREPRKNDIAVLVLAFVVGIGLGTVALKRSRANR